VLVPEVFEAAPSTSFKRKEGREKLVKLVQTCSLSYKSEGREP